MTDDIKPAEEAPPPLVLLGLARHVEKQPQPEPPPEAQEVVESEGGDAS